MDNIISIKRMREIRDPDVFINEVLNDPARLKRLDEKRKERLEQARKEAERKAEEAKQKEEFNFFLAKASIALAFIATVGGTLVALVF